MERPHVKGKGVLNIPGRVIATCFVIIAFVAASLVGLVAGNELHTILRRAIVVMLCCYPIGKILGFVIQKAIDHYVTDFKEKFPIPNEGSGNKEVLEQGVAPEQDLTDPLVKQGDGGAQGLAA